MAVRTQAEKARRNELERGAAPSYALFDGWRVYSQVHRKIIADGRMLGRWAPEGAKTPAWFARCAETGCENATNVSSKLGSRHQRCKKHSNTYEVAGRWTTSKRAHESRHLIVGWRKVRSGSYRAEMKCASPGCERRCDWTSNLSVLENAKRCCPPCGSNKRLLPPYRPNYNRLVDGANKRGIPVTLTYEQFAAICQLESCTYCRRKLERISNRSANTRGAAMAHLLDRVDHRRGYDLDNVVPCCGLCNITKSVWLSYEEMLILGALRSGDVAQAEKLTRKNAELIKENAVNLSLKPTLRAQMSWPPRKATPAQGKL